MGASSLSNKERLAILETRHESIDKNLQTITRTLERLDNRVYKFYFLLVPTLIGVVGIAIYIMILTVGLLEVLETSSN
ncbi:MAG: hypothetical protein F4Y79_12545 [Gemmatimonadetes bacterium]|nr:hypothetical protein [Gemmatimonadota bacterium]MYF18751.1 hypothetical protein [Gemmatimonadota bacterium]